MASSNPPRHAKHEEFSLPLFLLTVARTVAVLLAMLRFVAAAVWDLQRLAPPWKFAVTFAAVSLLNCFFEFFLHRYVLHLAAIPGLQPLYRQHKPHHALPRTAGKPAKDERG